MLKNYLKIVIRNLSRYKLFTSINVVGLVAGISVCLMILLWVANELSYDRFNKNWKNIYRVCVDLNAGGRMVFPMTSPPTAGSLINQFPEVLDAARLEQPGRASIKYKDNIFIETRFCHGDNSIFQLFTFPFISGDPQTALLSPYTVVITESTAQKYFGEENPIGEILKINGNNDYTITGVIKDIPENSHFNFTVMGSFQTLYAENKQPMDNWFHIQFYTYILLDSNTDYSNFENKIPAFVKKNMGELLDAYGATLDMFLQPLSRIHLYSDLSGDIAPQGDINYVYLFAGIALFVLILACVNFINLTTARSSTRSLEIAVRKTFGAERKQLIFQFLIEAIAFCFISVLIAGVGVELSMPLLKNLFYKDLSLNMLPSSSLVFIFGLFPIVLGLISGIYPALYLSRKQTNGVFNSSHKIVTNKRLFRNILVVFQFWISITLIIGTLVIFYQLNYMKNKDSGIEATDIVVLPRMKSLIQEKGLDFIKQKIEDIPGVYSVGGSSLIPGRGIQNAVMFPEGFSDDQPQSGEKLFVDADYLKTMGLELKEGRYFSKKLTTDSAESVIINETTARKFNWQEPIGKSFSFKIPGNGESNIVKRYVIGVVKDFHSTSFHSVIEPLIIYYNEERINFVTIKINSNETEQIINNIKKIMLSIAPEKPIEYFLFDKNMRHLYSFDERFGKIAFYFCLLTVLIGCMGLFGLTSFIIEKRTKEIGIRKVLGATSKGVILMISKEYLLLIAIANILSWPLAFWGVNKWLENFAYHINLNIWIYFAAAFLSLFIAFITVFYQTYKAANANPADALKYE